MEEWKPIPGYEGKYEASTLGRIRRLSGYYDSTYKNKFVRRLISEKILGGAKLSPKGYPRVNITGNVRFVHQIIALTWIPNPENKPQINHKNGIKTDNRVDNLEWVTNQENRDHAVKNSLHPSRKTGYCKLSFSDIEIIKSFVNRGLKQRDIGLTFGVCQQTISKALKIKV